MSPVTAVVLSLALAGAPPAPRRPPPVVPLSGLGLLVAAGVTGGLGLTAHLARIGIVRRGCANEFVYPELNVTVTVCLDESLRYLGYSAAAPLLNLAALGLAAGGGAVRGRHAAWRRPFDGRRAQVAPAYAGAGAGLLALGLVMYVGSRVALWRDPLGTRTCEAPTILSECVRARWSDLLAVTAAGQSLTVVGAGLLSFGVSYGRARRLQGALAELRVQPALSASHVGLTVGARF